MKLKEFRVDLHIHTCLSPCADLTMVPSGIIAQAKMQNLDIIGICDHNSFENIDAVKKTGHKDDIYVLKGIEITSSEEVHVMGFFDDNTDLKKIQYTIYKNLPGENDEDIFGHQLVVDGNDKIIGINNKLLIGATTLTVDKIVKIIHDFDGIAIASHIDRESFSVVGQLGFIPEDILFDAVEVSSNCPLEKVEEYKNYDLPIVTSSDAHFITDIGKSFTTFYINAPSFSEIKMALSNTDGRSIKV